MADAHFLHQKSYRILSKDTQIVNQRSIIAGFNEEDGHIGPSLRNRDKKRACKKYRPLSQIT